MPTVGMPTSDRQEADEQNAGTPVAASDGGPTGGRLADRQWSACFLRVGKCVHHRAMDLMLICCRPKPCRKILLHYYSSADIESTVRG